ncbi:MAG: UTP--glucose-1-phosphate uridylyltransferase GalU [bacterium]|nr:UTP--glucose-1-phosphate uridylyltransferase GalU [bacterium]
MNVRKAVFPAAGLGTRFLPATKASPKEMLPLVDKPLIQYGIEEAAASGLTQAIIVTGRGKRAIEDHFDISIELEHALEAKGEYELVEELRAIANLMSMCYVRQKTPLGLGHAILCASGAVGDEPFAVVLGDDIIDSQVPCLKQLLEVAGEHRASVIALERIPREAISRYGVIDGTQVGDRLWSITDLVEKPPAEEAPSDLAIIGRYILVPAIFPLLEQTKPDRKGEVQLTDALRALAAEEPLYGVVFEGKRYDAGDKLGFLQATVEYALKNGELGEDFRHYLRSLPL